MRFINSLILTAVLSLINLAWGADSPLYKDGILSIPSVNSPEQVGKYQDVTFKLTEQGTWQLSSVKTIGASVLGVPGIGLAMIEKIDAVKTDTFPTQVFLRVSGGFDPCGTASIGQINQRLENNRFDVTITINFLRPAPPNGCLPSVQLFLKTIPLSVYGLSAGTYSYNVNGTTGTFELTADNKYPGDY